MIISAVILIIISAALFTLSFFQFKEKGFLFNNAYLYASEEERKKMNKKPYYRQSGNCFYSARINIPVKRSSAVN